jgi:hypothetical protein
VYKPLVQQCVPEPTNEADKFTTFASIGVEGTLEDVRITWNGPGAQCLFAKLKAFHDTNAKPFPAPPRAPFMIKVDIDTAEFSPPASRAAQ